MSHDRLENFERRLIANLAVTDLAAKYYDWLTDNGGLPPETLLAEPLTEEQRQLLLELMDDVLIVHGLTSKVARAVKVESTAGCGPRSGEDSSFEVENYSDEQQDLL